MHELEESLHIQSELFPDKLRLRIQHLVTYDTAFSYENLPDSTDGVHAPIFDELTNHCMSTSNLRRLVLPGARNRPGA